ncbi:hypothetical protein PHLCEN_2v1444 [Hermanssonia centrifuga]|uniref:2',3'-cyclic-nucleotide 3'-phosphodiesterase n=1 Tax=Hermanssonia centrifuga TaxID=98765 RepID=A0A2R6S015_9APHY|nr:hypothetical protein PHLCEN_2v1444 [Hermanssonia centrifuga]
MGISLWLVPPADVAARLRRIMNMETKTSGTSFPHFPPHVTLATVKTSPEAWDTLSNAIPTHQSTIPVTFKAVKTGDTYFMSLYVEVHDTGKLHELREHLKESLSPMPVPPIPHLSLFYIDDEKPEERVEMMEELIHTNRIVERGQDNVALDCSLPSTQDVMDDDLISGFIGAEIWIVKCDGPPNTWLSNTPLDPIKLLAE